MANILVAEDERDIRELINFTLMFAGHTVTLAANGAEALELATKALTDSVKPDLIMMDVRMPKMTGYEACRQIKQLEAYKDTPVIFLSAKGQDEEIQTGLSVGATAYILKPFSPDDLIKRVAELTAKAAQSKLAENAPSRAETAPPEPPPPAPVATAPASTEPPNADLPKTDQ